MPRAQVIMSGKHRLNEALADELRAEIQPVAVRHPAIARRRANGIGKCAFFLRQAKQAGR